MEIEKLGNIPAAMPKKIRRNLYDRRNTLMVKNPKGMDQGLVLKFSRLINALAFEPLNTVRALGDFLQTAGNRQFARNRKQNVASVNVVTIISSLCSPPLYPGRDICNNT